MRLREFISEADDAKEVGDKINQWIDNQTDSLVQAIKAPGAFRTAVSTATQTGGKVADTAQNIYNKITGATTNAAKPATTSTSATPLPVSGGSKPKQVLDLISSAESRGTNTYDIVYGGARVPELLNMTISQVFNYQRTVLLPKKGNTPVGRYQYNYATLLDKTGAKGMNVDVNQQRFTPEFQDQLAIFDMRQRCGLDSWLSGQQSDQQFLNRLAKVWAGLPNTSGKSAHQGVAGNKNTISLDTALSTLKKIRES